MVWLAIIAFLALLAVIGCATGAYWAPTILGLAFLLPAVVLLVGHTPPLGVLLGLLYLLASIVELSAAHEYWTRRNMEAGPSRSWRVIATLVGLAGSAFLVIMVYGLLVFFAWLSSIS